MEYNKFDYDIVIMAAAPVDMLQLFAHPNWV